MTDAATIDRRFARSLGFFDPNKHENARVTFVGVGGIGSFAALAVAKLGVPNLTLIDPDTVDEVNAPNQMHPLEAADHKLAKVTSLAAQIRMHIATEVESYIAKITENGWEISNGLRLPPDFHGVVVSGLDSMQARKDLWHTKLKFNPGVSQYIDGRLAGQRILIYSVCPYDPDDVERYERTLVSDEDVEPAACTERGLIDVGFMVGALICRNVRKHLNGDELEKIIHVNENTLVIQKGGWVGP